MKTCYSRPVPPKTGKHPKTSMYHGIRRTDNYAWLRAKNWQEVIRNPLALDKRIREYLEAENAYQKTVMADTEALQKQLFAEMKGRIRKNDCSVPAKEGPYAYGVAYAAAGEQPRYFRTPRNGGHKTVYLDGDREAEGKEFFQLGAVNHAP
jgi:oligopeptidase B